MSLHCTFLGAGFDRRRMCVCALAFCARLTLMQCFSRQQFCRFCINYFCDQPLFFDVIGVDEQYVGRTELVFRCKCRCSNSRQTILIRAALFTIIR